MSNKKDSPVVETTVTKAGESIADTASSDSTEQYGQTSSASNQDNQAHYDSIEALKEATHITEHADDQGDEKAAAKKQNDDNKNSKTVAKSDNQANSTHTAKDADATSKTDKVPAASQAADNKDSNKKDADKTEDQHNMVKTTPSKSANKKSNNPSQNQPIRVAILGGNRIPFARSNGPYADASNIDMLSAALNGLVERFDLQGEKVGEVVAGAVLKLSRDLNLTRESALNTALDPHTPAYDVSQACGTGLQATFASANKIALGIIDSAITGGVDTTSDAPIAVGDGLRKALIQLGAAKNNKQRLKALLNINPKELIDAPQNGEPRTGLSMGEHQAITAVEWNISREAQDELAFNSHKNLARAYEEGFFDDLITPFKGLTRDNNLRPDTTLDKLAKLKPVFGKKGGNPTMTAANSTPLTDGASCVLLSNDEWAEAHGFKPLAYITHQETAAVDFVGKTGNKEGLLMAPAYAVPRMLERAGLTLQDFDFYEIHEAFASQVLSTLAAWEDETFCKQRLGLDAPLGSIDRSKLNVNGSSLAAGHPFAATGGRILATAAKLLDQKGSGRALISICAAGGQGVTCILEK